MRKKFDDAADTRQEFKTAGEAKNPQDVKAQSALIRKHGILVHHGIGRSPVDVEDFIKRQRGLHLPPCT